MQPEHLESSVGRRARVSCVPEDRTCLYRHFDGAGALLYVGISLNAVARLAQHRIGSPWFESITRIELEWHPTRRGAMAAEVEAIRAERPAHNVIHAGMPDSLRRIVEAAGKMHMVDANGVLLPEYASLGPGEAQELAGRL